MNKIKELLRVFIFMPVLKAWRFFITAILLLKLKNILNNQGEKIMIKSKLLTILFLSVLSFSCKREILTPEKIPERTVLQDEPIANLSIPSKDATLKITPYMLGNTKRTYGHADKFFKFKGKYYVLFFRRYQYNANDVTEIQPAGNWHLIEFDVKTMSLVETATNLQSEHIGVYQKLNDIADGKNAYEDKDKIYVVENNKYYSSSDLVNWQTNNSIFNKEGKIERKKVDTARIKIGNYTYVYTGGGLQFSISRLEKRMRQQASRLETKFDFKPYDFNNLHMFDIGLNENGSTNDDFRINPTNYINNNTDYEWIGMHNPHQVWLMPVEYSGKEYRIISDNGVGYPISEEDEGTTIYSPRVINLINYMDKLEDIDYIVMNSVICKIEEFDEMVDKFIKREKIDDDTYLGFLNVKTIYKLK